jgi:hypothetical protein
MLHGVWSRDLAVWDLRRIGSKVVWCLLEIDDERHQLGEKGNDLFVQVAEHEVALQHAIEQFITDRGLVAWGAPFQFVADFEAQRERFLSEAHLMPFASGASLLALGPWPVALMPATEAVHHPHPKPGANTTPRHETDRLALSAHSGSSQSSGSDRDGHDSLEAMAAWIGAAVEATQSFERPGERGPPVEIKRMELAGLSAAHLLLRVLEVGSLGELSASPYLRFAAGPAVICMAQALAQQYRADSEMTAALAAVRLGLNPESVSAQFNDLLAHPKVFGLFMALGGLTVQCCKKRDQDLFLAMRFLVGQLADMCRVTHNEAEAT